MFVCIDKMFEEAGLVCLRTSKADAPAASSTSRIEAAVCSSWLVSDEENEEEPVPAPYNDTQLDESNDVGEEGSAHNEPESAPKPDSDTMDDQVPPQPQVVPVPTFTPHVRTEGHRTICETLLPVLWEVLQEPQYRALPPRDSVREACWRVLSCLQRLFLVPGPCLTVGHTQTHTNMKQILW